MKVFCVVFLGCVSLSLAASINWQQFLDELDHAELDLVELDPDDSSEERGLLTNSKGKNRCSCSAGNNCGCCARVRIPKVGKLQGCLNVTVLPEDKKVDIAFEGQGMKIVGYKFSIARADRVCQPLPGFLDALRVCIYSAVEYLTDKSGLQTCPRMEILKGDKIVGKVVTACVQFKDGQLGLNDNGEVKAKDLLEVRGPNVFKGILNWLGLREPSDREETAPSE